MRNSQSTLTRKGENKEVDAWEICEGEVFLQR